MIRGRGAAPARALTTTLFVLAALVGAPAIAAAKPAVPAVARPAPGEAGWILAAQLPNGAIASHTDRSFVNPYLGAYGALGLATATRVSGNPQYAAAAWRWAEWYGRAMDANGYVTDYSVADAPTGNQLVSTGSYDSTDAYAGMYLTALDATYSVAPDSARLRALAPKIALAVHAIRSTQRADGLTGAKPDWMVAYLMNDAEAYSGLRAATDLARVLHDGALARDAENAAAALANGVDHLWNPATGALDWAVHPNGVHIVANWSQLYPDAMSQLWAVRFGLLHGAHATAVLQQFARSHPHAADPTALDLVDGTTGPGGYWPSAGLALALLDRGAPARFIAGTRTAAAATGRAWPYSVQTAGETIELVAVGT